MWISGLAAAAVAAALAVSPARAATPGAAAANEAGGQLFNTGQLPEAVAKFDEAVALDPGFEQARNNLATALAALAQRELHAGNLDDARSHLERAVGLAPDRAPPHLLLGVLFLRRGDLYEARQRVNRALEIAPGLAAAREVSGDLFYQEGSLEQARAEWEAALAANGPHGQGLRAKLERLGREAGAEGAFGRDVSRHFTIQYDGPVPAQVARAALRLLEKAYDRLWYDFGRPPQHDVLVILYARQLFKEIMRSPDWVAGSYDGKIRIPVGGLSTEQEAEQLAPVLAHELTHAFIHANVPGRPPLWFEEGLAQYYEGKTTESALHVLRASGGGFASLEEVNSALTGGPRVGAGYAAALIAVSEMVRIDGLWLLRRTLESLASGQPFAAAFHDVSGLEFPEFQERWVRAQR